MFPCFFSARPHDRLSWLLSCSLFKPQNMIHNSLLCIFFSYSNPHSVINAVTRPGRKKHKPKNTKRKTKSIDIHKAASKCEVVQCIHKVLIPTLYWISAGLLQTKLDKTLAAKPKTKFSCFFFIFLDRHQDGLSWSERYLAHIGSNSSLI